MEACCFHTVKFQNLHFDINPHSSFFLAMRACPLTSLSVAFLQTSLIMPNEDQNHSDMQNYQTPMSNPPIMPVPAPHSLLIRRHLLKVHMLRLKNKTMIRILNKIRWLKLSGSRVLPRAENSANKANNSTPAFIDEKAFKTL